jgi:hypothetical protein
MTTESMTGHFIDYLVHSWDVAMLGRSPAWPELR